MASRKPIYVTQPELPPLEEFMPYLRQIWDTRVLSNGGPFHQMLEAALCEYLGVKHISLFTNATIALVTALQSLRITGEVITTPYSFVATAHSLMWNGIKPVFVDVDPVTLDIDPDAAAAAVTERTKGLLPIDIFGWPAAWPELEALAAKHGLGVLEDSCEALGAVDSEGRRVGTRGNFSTFAFYANKQMTTGEGGMIVPTDPGAAARLRSERNQGRAVDMGWLDHDRLGFNYRLSDVQAAIGLAQVEKLPRLLERRAGVAAAYAERLAGVAGVEAPLAARGQEVRSWFVYVVRLADEVDRDAVIRALRERGIDSKSYLPSVHLFPQFAEFGYGEGQFPIAEAASAHSLALPFFPALGEAQVERVCTELARAVDASRRGLG
jgi:perosamine synthetase